MLSFVPLSGPVSIFNLEDYSRSYFTDATETLEVGKQYTVYEREERVVKLFNFLESSCVW